MATIIIQHQDGTIYDLDALDFRVKKFDPPTAAVNYAYTQVGNYGARLAGAQVAQLVIPLTLVIKAVDNPDYRAQLISLRRIFLTDEDFYVIDQTVPFLRYRVRAEQISPTQNNNFWQSNDVTVNLDCADGYAETTTTTGASDFTSELYVFGINLPDTLPKYSFTTSSFTFYNAGNIPLTADERPVTITFKGTAAGGLTIANKTTGQSIKITKALKASDTLTIAGMVPMINGQQAYADSDHGYLDFKRGNNQIQVTGASNFTISFDTRFYY